MNKLISILKDIFDNENINVSSKMADIAEWDSFSHMKLIVSLEKRFKVQFTHEEIIKMLTVEQIAEILNSKGENLE